MNDKLMFMAVTIVIAATLVACSTDPTPEQLSRERQERVANERFMQTTFPIREKLRAGMTVDEVDRAIRLDSVFKRVMVDIVRRNRIHMTLATGQDAIRQGTYVTKVTVGSTSVPLVFDWEGKLLQLDPTVPRPESQDAVMYKIFRLLRAGMTYDEVEVVVGPFPEFKKELFRSMVRMNFTEYIQHPERRPDTSIVGKHSFEEPVWTGRSSTMVLKFDWAGRYLICRGNNKCSAEPGSDRDIYEANFPWDASVSDAPKSVLLPPTK